MARRIELSFDDTAGADVATWFVVDTDKGVVSSSPHWTVAYWAAQLLAARLGLPCVRVEADGVMNDETIAEAPEDAESAVADCLREIDRTSEHIDREYDRLWEEAREADERAANAQAYADELRTKACRAGDEWSSIRALLMPCA